MKKIFTTIALAATLCAQAQNVTIHLTNGNTVSYPANEVSYVDFTPGGENPGDHAYVDLGLSVKWATMNIGAISVVDYGDYFAWGETATKEDFNQGNCPTQGQKITWTPQQNDAAYVQWGPQWRVPSADEMQELLDNCTWEWTSISGVPGYKVTSNKEGFTSNSIFLPAAGYRVGGALNSADVMCYYWTSTPSPANNAVSKYLTGSKDAKYLYWSNRFQGYSIRPVRE